MRAHLAILLNVALVAPGCDRRLPRTGALASPAASFASAPTPATPNASTTSAALVPLAASQLCVTEGSLAPNGDRFSVDSSQFRAVTSLLTEPSAELRFTYLGPTGETVRLGSGRSRRQIGLKLRAQDACNLVYAMWRLDPRSEVVVQVKRNPGQQTSAECGNRGYRNVRASHSAEVPAIIPGSSHVLRAQMRGAMLTVWADDQSVWEGSVGDDVLEIDGPVGLRTDNGRYSIAFYAAGGGAPPGVRQCDSAVAAPDEN